MMILTYLSTRHNTFECFICYSKKVKYLKDLNINRYVELVMLGERQIIHYTALELEIMRLKKENILNEIKILNLANRCVICPSQEAIANEVKYHGIG